MDGSKATTVNRRQAHGPSSAGNPAHAGAEWRVCHGAPATTAPGSLSLAFLDFQVQHLQGVLLTGSEGERTAGRFPAVHRRPGYAEQAGELGDRESAPRRSSATRRPVGWNPDGGAPVRRGLPRRRRRRETRPPVSRFSAAGRISQQMPEPTGYRGTVGELDVEDCF